MKKPASSWLLVSVCAVMLSSVGFGPGTAMAGNAANCRAQGDPLRLELTTVSEYVLKKGGDVQITATLSNCSTSDWLGNVAVTVTGGYVPQCVVARLLPQQVTVKAGLMQAVRFKGLAPICTGPYIVDGTANDTAVQARAQTGFSVVAAPGGKIGP